MQGSILIATVIGFVKLTEKVSDKLGIKITTVEQAIFPVIVTASVFFTCYRTCRGKMNYD